MRLVRVVLAITLGFEAVGALISFIVFRKDYSPLHAIGISIFILLLHLIMLALIILEECII